MTNDELCKQVALRLGYSTKLIEEFKTPPQAHSWATDDGLALTELWPRILKAVRFGVFLYSDRNGHSVWETRGIRGDEKQLSKCSDTVAEAICLAFIGLVPLRYDPERAAGKP